MTAHEASSSSFSKSELWTYDVFLSFRGEDTRNGFTSHLHEALKYRGYHVFIDEVGLKRGEEIKQKLFRAIEESRISIIVFSKMYADSSWCLDELVKIMECRDKLGRHVLPIFYHVDPSNVRRQDGDLTEAFQKHEKDIREEKDDKKREAKQERVKQWREALTKAANLSGHHLQSANNRKRRREAHTEATNLSDHQTTGNGREAEFIKKIVDESIWEWLPRTNELHVTKHLVGIKSRIQGIISDLSSGGSNDVLMVGIWGMGGLGKTTAAKSIYNQIHCEFEFKSFLADVSDDTSKHGLVYLQETLISDIHILEEKSQIRSVDKGISMIQEVVKHKRVLVVMDNIDEEVQLHAIAGSRDWFGPGSRIIITTRDERLLLNVDKVYPLQVMNEDEALELFSWHAFGNSWPDKVYLEVSKKVVSYCGGRPGKWCRLWDEREVMDVLINKSGTRKVEGLALNIPFYSKSFSTKAFAKMKKLRLLDLSFVELKGEYKHLPKELIWLRWECPLKSIPDDFFNQPRLVVLDMQGSSLVQVWEGSKSLHNLKTLDLSYSKSVQKSPDFSQVPNLEELILEKCDNLFEIHPSIGHLQRLSLVNLMRCRNLISLPRDFYKSKSVETLLLNGCSQLELHEDIGEMISLRTLEAEHTTIREVPPSILRLKNLTRLSLHHISYVELSGVELICLRWEECPLKSIPDDFFNQDKLVVLKMQESKLVQVWEGSKSLHNLKTLDLSFSYYLQKSPDFSQVPNLEELILEECESLSEIHPSIGHLKRLSLVNLQKCDKLISLPRDFYKSKSVGTLLLNWCLEFREVHEDIGEMISLRTLEADETAIREVPPSIVRLKNLTHLSLSGVENIHLPYSLHGLNSLRELDLSFCRLADDAIPKDLGSLISLQVLDLSWNDFHTLPNLSGLSKLETLQLDTRFNLCTIPDIPPNVKVQRGYPEVNKCNALTFVQSLIYHQM
ncbi:disease resistance protein RPV1 isoform X5 [Pyrus x bretschneideri]|uniref:disease resistance protein RPV1 isoform X5 n=1 Tax=Pyrus x bretschneideri TaxID=225117 RepID=UPI00202EC167|nr:disease resistance protein RPV1 isoform X5 [Pyrus x bretschneideri]